MEPVKIQPTKAGGPPICQKTNNFMILKILNAKITLNITHRTLVH
jgi:hypothetical protein